MGAGTLLWLRQDLRLRDNTALRASRQAALEPYHSMRDEVAGVR